MNFDSGSDQVQVKVALSSVSTKNAWMNLRSESADWDFQNTVSRARNAWNKELGRIEVKGATAEQYKVFYTALYHCMVVPNVYSDVNGQYRGRDGKVHTAEGYTRYTVFSLWDTFRAWHPLMTVIDRKRTLDYIRTFLAQYQEGGLLPVWELSANETECMIGYHAVPVIVDAGVGTASEAAQAMELGCTGVLMNNGINWFDTRPDSPNCIAPSKRPLTNMCPVIVTRKNGEGWFAIGASGGRKIMPAVTQVCSFLIDHGMNLEDAFHQPRIDASGELDGMLQRITNHLNFQLKLKSQIRSMLILLRMVPSSCCASSRNWSAIWARLRDANVRPSSRAVTMRSRALSSVQYPCP